MSYLQRRFGQNTIEFTAWENITPDCGVWMELFTSVLNSTVINQVIVSEIIPRDLVY